MNKKELKEILEQRKEDLKRIKTLYLEKRGCDFGENEHHASDIGNFRVCTRGEEIKGKDGNIYFLEFSLWRNRGHYRKINKKTNKTLKKPVYEIDIKEALAINTQYTNKDGSWKNIELERNLFDNNLEYTKADILKAVNIISKDKYNKIEFIGE